MYYGCKPEIKDRRDFKMTTMGKYYPAKFELQIGKIKDQGIVNSCVAHTLASFLEQQNIQNDIKFSTGFIYGYRPEGYSQDQGMYPRQAIKTLKDIGDVLKEDFDHNKEMKEIKNLVDKNLINLKDLANKFKIKSYARIYNINEIKDCIMNNVTVPVSIPVYGDIELNNNIIQITNKPVTGYHMMLIYGWNENGFLVQNSWGKLWGRKGTAILPYEYPIDSAWAIETEYNFIINKPTWKTKLINFILKIISYFKRS